jgi:hypothetical protein
MIPILVWILASTLDANPWTELSLSLERDRYTSSDQVTLFRVRVRNHGSRSWPGRSLRFEIRAIDGGAVVARESGRFGLTLPPYGTLETLIALPGRYDRVEIEPVAGSAGRSGAKTSRGRKPGAGSRKPRRPRG